MKYLGCINAFRGICAMDANPTVMHVKLPDPMTSVENHLLLPEPNGKGGRFWRRCASVPMVGDWVLDSFGGVWIPQEEE